MFKPDNRKKRSEAKYLLSALMLVCILALSISIGKTYAVITEASVVVVNTFSGESEPEEEESEESESKEPDASEPDSSESEEPESEESESSESESSESSDAESSESSIIVEAEASDSSESEEETGGADTADTAKTGDSASPLIWIVIAAAALAGIVIISVKMLRARNEN